MGDLFDLAKKKEEESLFDKAAKYQAEQPQGGSLFEQARESASPAQPRPTLTPGPTGPAPGNLTQAAGRIQEQRQLGDREMLRAAGQIDSEVLANKVRSGQPLTPVEQRAWQEQSGQAVPTRELETAAVIGTSLLFPPIAAGPAALGTVGRTALGTGLIGGTENVAIDTVGIVSDQKRLPTVKELATSFGTGFLFGGLAGGASSKFLGKTGDNFTFGRKTKDIADYYGTTPSQINKYLKEGAEQLGTDRGTIADGLIGHAVKTQPEGPQAFARYIDEVATKSGIADGGVPGSTAIDDATAAFQSAQARAGQAGAGGQSSFGDTVYEPNLIKNEINDEIAKQATKVLRGREGLSDEQVSKQIMELMMNNEVEVDGLRPLIDKMGLDYETFAKQYKETASWSGRNLAYLSRTKRQLQSHFKGTEAEKIFDEMAANAAHPSDPIIDGLSSVYRTIDNVQRASLVAQLETQMRNVDSTVARGGIEVLDTMVQGIYRGKPREGLAEAWTEIMVLTGRMPKAQRAAYMKALEEFPIEHQRLFSAPVMDVVALDKYTKTINTHSRWLEFGSRRLGLQARLARNLQRAGYDPFTVKFADVPTDVLRPAMQDAVDFSLDLTWANKAKNQISRSVINAFNAMPLLNQIQRFPRFAYANSWQYMFEFTPAGWLRLLNKGTRQAIANGNTTALSRATVGTALTAVGMALRSSEYAGDEWYELNIGGKTLDTRLFAPLNVYLFLGELIVNPSNLKPGDAAAIALGMTRVAGTGLVIFDLLKGERGGDGTWLGTLQDYASAYIGGFSVPARTPLEIAGGVEQLTGRTPEEAYLRDTDQMPWFGSFLGNIPGANRLIPPVNSIYTGEPLETDYPLVEQFTGIKLRNRTETEEMAREADVKHQSIFPRTGIPEADNEIQKLMGIAMQNMENPKHQRYRLPTGRMMPYTELPKTAQRIVMRDYFKEARKRAMRVLEKDNPTLYRQVQQGRRDKDEVQLEKELGIEPAEKKRGGTPGFY